MSWGEVDRKYLWHPYTQHKTVGDFPVIVKGKDALLWDENGNEYIDAIASWWVNPFGHSNKFIAKKIYNQLTTLEHVLFGGFTHNKAAQLALKLMEILPQNQSKIFFSDNGSTAVEVAIKAAFQYFFNKGEVKSKIIAFEDAFHGDTFAAMAVSGINIFTQAFKKSLIEVVRISLPNDENWEKYTAEFHSLASDPQVAAFIFEPLVQGAAGMKMYKSEYLNEMIKICQKHGIFTISDEVMTGFGKTGKNFASDYLQEKPDMICLSKALTAGVVPMAITTFSEKIYQGFWDNDTEKAFFHGHSFTANPTGCAAALASLELLEKPETLQNINRINQLHKTFEQKIKLHPKVENTRVLGVIFALDLKTNEKQAYYGELRNKLYHHFIKNGIILRPVSNTIYILPPYIITNEQLQKVYMEIERALEI